MKSTTILVAALLIVAACKSTTKEEVTKIESTPETFVSAIQPLQGLDVAPTVYEVIAENGAEIKLPNGGTINVPAGAFEDKDGNEVAGPVKIEWQEFHSLTDIMLSGIPMKYDSAGVQNNFVSGGMFTINANRNGDEMFIRNGKTVDVDLVSIDDTPCYNFYELDEKSGDWTYETTANGTPIEKEVAPKKAVKTYENTLIDCEVDFSLFPELQDKNIVAWSAIDDLSKREQIEIKNNISQLTLQQDDESYYLNFKRQEKETKLRVKPFLLEDAQAKTKTLQQEIEVDYAQLRSSFQAINSGRTTRSISLDNFGTFNWDCIHRMTDIQPIAAEFEYDGDIINPSAMNLFYVCADDNLIIRCGGASEQRFFYSPNKNNVLVAISPEKEVYILDNSGFETLKKNRAKKSHTFLLESTGLVAESGSEVGEIVRSVF